MCKNNDLKNVLSSKSHLNYRDQHLCDLQWKLLTEQKESVMWQLSRQSLSRHRLNRRKIIVWRLFLTLASLPLKLECITFALAAAIKVAYSKSKISDVTAKRTKQEQTKESQTNACKLKKKVRPRLEPQTLWCKGYCFIPSTTGKELNVSQRRKGASRHLPNNTNIKKHKSKKN